jgi:hypothetical protein
MNQGSCRTSCSTRTGMLSHITKESTPSSSGGPTNYRRSCGIFGNLFTFIVFNTTLLSQPNILVNFFLSLYFARLLHMPVWVQHRTFGCTSDNEDKKCED